MGVAADATTVKLFDAKAYDKVEKQRAPRGSHLAVTGSVLHILAAGGPRELH